MTATNHALTGALVAISISNPLIGLPLAFMSHFIIDMLPHWDHKARADLQKFIDAGDVLLAGLLVVSIALVMSDQAALILTGALLGTLPDAMWLPEILQGRKVKMKGSQLIYRIRRWHQGIQWSETPKGLFVEVLWFILVLNLIFLP